MFYPQGWVWTITSGAQHVCSSKLEEKELWNWIITSNKHTKMHEKSNKQWHHFKQEAVEVLMDINFVLAAIKRNHKSPNKHVSWTTSYTNGYSMDKYYLKQLAYCQNEDKLEFAAYKQSPRGISKPRCPSWLVFWCLLITSLQYIVCYIVPFLVFFNWFPVFLFSFIVSLFKDPSSRFLRYIPSPDLFLTLFYQVGIMSVYTQ